jgi:hypothetical protein
MGDQQESDPFLAGTAKKEMISKAGVLRRHPFGEKPEITKLRGNNLPIAHNARSIAGKAVNSYQPLEKIERFGKALLQHGILRSKIT